MECYDITQVAKLSGVKASALRYYEEKGLVSSIGRKGLKRVFEAHVFDRLALITLGQKAGFSLDEMVTMLNADGSVKISRDMLAQKAKEIDLKIQQLTVMREGLRHAAACKAPNYFSCPKFLRILNVSKRKSQKGAKPVNISSYT